MPFVSKTTETWVTNFFSSMYYIILKTIYQIYCISVILPFVFHGEGIAHKGFTDQEINNIVKEKSLFRVFFYIGIGCFVFTTFINIMHIF